MSPRSQARQAFFAAMTTAICARRTRTGTGAARTEAARTVSGDAMASRTEAARTLLAGEAGELALM
jgi:hypothetical protein